MIRVLKPSELPRLSPEDEKKPYAEFYYRGAVEPSAEIMEQLSLENAMDPKYAVYPDNVNVMLDGRYMERETGFCILPDGTGYASILTKMDGVTPEVNDWWGPWHEQDDLRYKCWFPGAHQKVGDCWAQEDVGKGLENVFFVGSLNPHVVGFDEKRVAADPTIVCIRGRNGYSLPADNATSEMRPVPQSVMHFIRTTDTGIEYRSRFWVGIHFRNGRAIRMIPKDQQIPLEWALNMVQHCAYEMATLASILPELHSRFKDLR